MKLTIVDNEKAIIDAMKDKLYWDDHEPGQPDTVGMEYPIGGTMAAAIYRDTPWSSKFTVYHNMKHGVKADMNAAMSRGIFLEGIIRESAINIIRYCNKCNEIDTNDPTGNWLRVHEAPGRYGVKDTSVWQVAHIDGLVSTSQNELMLLEIKTAARGDHWKEGVPLHYEHQVQWCLHIMGLTRCVLIALVESSPRVFVIEANSKLQEAMVGVVSEFRNKYLLGDDMPEASGLEAEVDIAIDLWNKKHRKYDVNGIKKPVLTPADFAAMNSIGARYIDAKSNVKYWETKARSMKANLLGIANKYDGCREFLADEIKVLLSSFSRTSVDTKAIAEHHPDIYQQYERKTNVTQLRVSKVKGANDE